MNEFGILTVPNHFMNLCYLIALMALVSPERLFHLGLHWWRSSLNPDVTQRMRYVLIISGFFYTLLNCIILPLAYSPSQIWRYFAIMWQSDRIDNGAIIVLMVLNVAMLLFTIILGVHFYRKPTKFAKYVRQGRKYSRSGYLYTSDVRARMIVSIYPKD